MTHDRVVVSGWGRGVFMTSILVAFFAALWATRDRRLPEPVTAISQPPAERNRCSACHAAVVSDFERSPHRKTLRRAVDSGSLELLVGVTQAHPIKKSGVLLWPDPYGCPVTVSTRFGSTASQRVTADWLFGSGKHAHTPVSVWLNADGDVELLEHRLSWYPQHGWGETLGLSEAGVRGEPTENSREGLESLGQVHDPAATRACFGCHTSYLPFAADGRNFDWPRIVPGVSCERCHPRGERHAQAMDLGAKATRRDHWRDLTPLEAVNRCGECHRRADHLTPDELVPENKLLVRFASVGLVQSACFQKQSAHAGNQRLDCVTCHDPHQPAKSDWKFYVERCATCHAADAPRCSQQPLDSNCLPCHMPQVEVQPPLKFTDHWIRKRLETSRDNRED